MQRFRFIFGFSILVVFTPVAFGRNSHVLSTVRSSPPPIGNKTFFEDEDCSNPGPYIEEVLQVANKSQNISDVLKSMNFPACTSVGVNTSFSAQHSLGNRDPRIYIKTRCRILTVTLWGTSVELGIVRQKAVESLPRAVKEGRPTINKESEGEILVDMRNFPRGEKKFSASQGANPVVNVWNHQSTRNEGGHYESKRCVGCHNDVKQTKGPYGLKEITVGQEKFSAIVSPYYTRRGEGAEGELYCFPRDLQLLYHCECEMGEKARQCDQFDPIAFEGLRAGDIRMSWGAKEKETAREESCRRMEMLIQMNGCQNSQFDPREANEPGEKGKCKSDGWKPGNVTLPRKTSRVFERGRGVIGSNGRRDLRFPVVSAAVLPTLHWMASLRSAVEEAVTVGEGKLVAVMEIGLKGK